LRQYKIWIIYQEDKLVRLQKERYIKRTFRTERVIKEDNILNILS